MSRITPFSRPRHRMVALIAAVAVTVSLIPAAGAADDGWLTESERQAAEANRQRQAELRGEINVLRSSDVELEAESDRLDGRIAELRASTADLDAALEEARTRARSLAGEVATARQAFEEWQKLAADRVVRAYMQPPLDTLSVVLAAEDLTQAERRMTMADNVAAHDRQVLEERRAAAETLASLEAEAAATAEQIAAASAQQQAELVELRDAKARAEQVQAELEQRISHVQNEVAGLARSEADLVALISARQTAATTTTAPPATTVPPTTSPSSGVGGGSGSGSGGGSGSGSGGGGTSPTPTQAPPTQAPQPSPPPPSSGGALVWPANGVLTSTFGWRWGAMHQGIDIGAANGSPIYAADSGTVFYAGWMGGYGNIILIDHGGGRVTAYAHQSGFAVRGGGVGRGQVIGYVGNTGDSTGPHLHFELRVNGNAVDPLPYLR
jgi:murein DD-endopeptidase MepM/ murein hydrolase activator NlpD